MISDTYRKFNAFRTKYRILEKIYFSTYKNERLTMGPEKEKKQKKSTE